MGVEGIPIRVDGNKVDNRISKGAGHKINKEIGIHKDRTEGSGAHQTNLGARLLLKVHVLAILLM